MVLPHLSGYIFLALLAILAPTPIPVPLDGIILGLIAAGYNPLGVLAIAFISDIIGTFLIFVLGRKGRHLLAKYRQKRQRRDYVIAEGLFKAYGKYALLLGGIPFLGDALIFLAGFYKLSLEEFIIWFTAGKVLWYLLLGGSLVLTGRPLLPF